MSEPRVRALALRSLQDGSRWNAAKLVEGQGIAVHDAYAFNIPMTIYDTSSRDFGSRRMNDPRAHNIFSMLVFFMHLVEHAAKEVCTNTTSVHRQREREAAEREQQAGNESNMSLEAQLVQAMSAARQGGRSRSSGHVFNPTSSPVVTENEPMDDDNFQALLDELDNSMDDLLPASEEQPAPSGQVEIPIPIPVDTNAQLTPSILVLLEQVPYEGHRVPGEGRFHEMLDMLQERPPHSYTLHVLVCGIDIASIMRRVLGINTLRTRELPVFTTSYATDQSRNLFIQSSVRASDVPGEDYALQQNQRGARGSRGRGRGRGRGSGRAGVERTSRVAALMNREADEDEDENEQEGNVNSAKKPVMQVPLWIEEASKRRRTFNGGKNMAPAARESWEQFMEVTYDTLGSIYADMFGGSQKANEYYTQQPGKMMDLTHDNPCHPKNLFNVASALYGRGSSVSYVQRLEFYARHHQQMKEYKQIERMRNARGASNNNRPLPKRISDASFDAIKLAPRCPYVPREPEIYATDNERSVYVWTPPPGTCGRFLSLSITELTCATFCNKVLPHMQRDESVLVRVWPGLFGRNAKQLDNVSGRNADDESMMRILRGAGDLQIDGSAWNAGDIFVDENDRELYNMLPYSLRSRLNNTNLVEFGPQVRCPVVDGQYMSIEQVQRLLNIMQETGDIAQTQAQVISVKNQVEIVRQKIVKHNDSKRVRQQREKRQPTIVNDDGTENNSSFVELCDNDTDVTIDLQLRNVRNSMCGGRLRCDSGSQCHTTTDNESESVNGSSYNTNTMHSLQRTSSGSFVLPQDNASSSSVFSFADIAFGSNTGDNRVDLGSRGDTIGFGSMFREHSLCTSGSYALEQTSHSMPALRHYDGGFSRENPADTIDNTDENTPPSTTDAQRDEEKRQRALCAAAAARVNSDAPSDVGLRAQRMNRLNLSLSEAHTARLTSRELREKLETLEQRLNDLIILCRQTVRDELLQAQQTYDKQLQNQTRWLQSIRALASMCGENRNALPFTTVVDNFIGANNSSASVQRQAQMSVSSANGVSQLENATAATAVPSRANNASLLLHGFYAKRESERTGQNIVDVSEVQGNLWNQLNSRLLGNKERLTNADMRIWTMIQERSAMRAFQQDVYDPNANIPVALSVIFQCARDNQLHLRQGRMMHARMDSRLGCMQDHMARMLEWYNALFCIAKCQLTLMGWISSQCATHHANELHPNMLVMGDAASSKTYPLAVLVDLRCNLGSREVRKTTVESTRQTQHSSSHDGRHSMDYRVVIENEASKEQLIGKDGTGDDVLKQTLDHCQNFVQTLERNTDTNRFEYTERFASCIGVRLMCANWPVAELPTPIRTRVILMLCTQPRGALGNIAQAMARRQEQTAADETKTNCITRYHNFLHYAQAMMDSMIACGAMKDVNMWLASFVITYVNNELKKRLRPTIEPRFIMHIKSWIRAIVKETVLAREFSYIGGIFQAHDVTPERVQLLQPYLYANMSTVVFTLGMLSRYSGFEGEDDVRKAVSEIMDRQRKTLRAGLDITRSFADMFRIKGYQRQEFDSDIRSARSNVSEANVPQSRNQFTSSINTQQMVDSDFMELNEEDSHSTMAMDSVLNQSHNRSSGFDTNFPGLREHLTPAIVDRGVLPSTTADSNNNSDRPFQYNDGNRRKNRYTYQNKAVRDYRFVTFRLRGLNNVGVSGDYKCSPLQQASSNAAAMLLPTLKELNSTVTRDIICALLMHLSEQYIKSPQYYLDKEEQVQVCNPPQWENIRVVEFEPGLMHVSYCWLQLIDVNTTRVMRDILVQLNSHRYQPYELCLWQHDEMFPNTFETLEIGHRDCEDAKHKELILENPAHYSSEELSVLYTPEELVHHQSKEVPLMRINCSLNELAAEKRASELHWYNGYVTERDMARVLYSRAEETFGADRFSAYHNVLFESSDFASLDDTQCLQMPDCYYHVPNKNWNPSSPPNVPSTVAHWDVLLAHVKNVEERRRVYCQLSYFTNEEVIKHRMQCWETYTNKKYIHYPTALKQRFMENITQYVADTQEQSKIRNLLEEELKNQLCNPISEDEHKIRDNRRVLARESMKNLRNSSFVEIN